jgi:prevent-host-death family protein
MKAPNLVEDICPVSEFRADINNFITKTRETHRPIVLTQRGRSTAVVLDINEYQKMVNRLNVIDELDNSKKRYEQGEYLSSDKARERLLGKYKDV